MIVTEMLVRVRESPVAIVALLDSCPENPNVPEVEADQKETSVSTSLLVPAHDVQAGLLEADTTPAEADPHVTLCLVVTEETLLVPAAPGAPV